MSNTLRFERPEEVHSGPTGDQVVGMLDSLLDAMVVARPGRNSAALATDIRRLGTFAAYFAERIIPVRTPSATGPTPETLTPRKQRHALGA